MSRTFLQAMGSQIKAENCSPRALYSRTVPMFMTITDLISYSYLSVPRSTAQNPTM
eukprot:SAG25_NODE_30_length_20554_cov_36.028694_11_plen_56_part_00